MRQRTGLAAALAEATRGGSSVIPQPWILGSIQAHSSSATASDEAAADAASGPAPGSSTPAAAEGPARTKLPPGQIDFSKRQLVMMFTCAKCETRAAKAFSKAAYSRGVVIVECPGCNASHLVADHLGWYGAKGTIEEFVAERGGTVVSRLADSTLELTPEEVYGPH